MVERIMVYRLIDNREKKVSDMDQGYVFSKKEAEAWVAHGYGFRSHHELFICSVFKDKKCAEDCGDWNIHKQGS